MNGSPGRNSSPVTIAVFLLRRNIAGCGENVPCYKFPVVCKIAHSQLICGARMRPITTMRGWFYGQTRGDGTDSGLSRVAGIFCYRHQNRNNRTERAAFRRVAAREPCPLALQRSLAGGIVDPDRSAMPRGGRGSLQHCPDDDDAKREPRRSLSGLALLALLSVKTGQKVEGNTLDPKPLRGADSGDPSGRGDRVPRLHRAGVALLDPDRVCEGRAFAESDYDFRKGVHVTSLHDVTAQVKTVRNDLCVTMRSHD
jgi:hypothetical protein